MTDYIELALGEQEDEQEEREGLAWVTERTGHIPGRSGETLETPGMDVGQGGERGLPPAATGPRPPLETPVLAEDLRGQAVKTGGDEWPRRQEHQLAMMEHETRRRQATAGEAAQGLRAKLRQAEVAAAYRGESAPIEVREEWGGGKGRSVLELDAAFARDARRYDNGFELF